MSLVSDGRPIDEQGQLSYVCKQGVLLHYFFFLRSFISSILISSLSFLSSILILSFPLFVRLFSFSPSLLLSFSPSFFPSVLLFFLSRSIFNSVVSLLLFSLSIFGIYIAPLQGNYSEPLPAQARAKIKVLRRL